MDKTEDVTKASLIKIAGLIKELNESELVDFTVIQKTTDVNSLSTYPTWVGGRTIYGEFLVRNTEKQFYRFLFIGENDYLLIFSEDKTKLIAQIHHTIKRNETSEFIWKYSPTKRDGKNTKRKEYFEQSLGSTDFIISFPEIKADVNDFFDDLFLLADNRLEADKEDGVKPILNKRFPEGKRVERLHKSRERSSCLIRSAKNEFIKKYNKLYCQICEFSFEDKYGEIGKSFIEAHHIKPLSELEDETDSTINDIILVCSNCHRMLHRKRPWLSVENIKHLVRE